MNTQKPVKANLYTVIGGVLFSIILIVVGIVIIVWAGKMRKEPDITPEVKITQIPAPTSTPRIVLPTEMIVETSTPAVILPPDVIGIGAYVQVTGTEGSGLRMRSDPGTNSEERFVAMDSEAFLVIGGPVEQDGYNWWQLEAPYDKTRTGWSADAYLTRLESETTNP